MVENQLVRGAPEAQGISSKAILRFIEAVEANIRELHSFMLMRHGVVVAEGWWSPYAPQHPHMLFSLSKSFTSTGIGLAVTEDRLSIDDPVISFFPEDLPTEVSPNLAAMRIRHLLSMSTGHGEDTTPALHQQPEGNWAKAFLSCPVDFQPGTHFVYNSGATYMLSAILQKVTGMKLIDYLQPRLFEPLGIEGPTWETCPRGINTGGWGLSIKTEDIARFGQLYLQKGVWNGKRILPESWITLATSKHIDNGTDPNSDWNQGYGFQFWRCKHNNYRGDGAFGQYCIVMPEQDAVLAITSGLEGEMQAPLNLVWDILLPAMQPTPLPEDPGAVQALAEKAHCLKFLPPQMQSTSQLAETISGKTFHFDPNALGALSVRFDFQQDQLVVTAKAAANGAAIPTSSLAASGALASADSETSVICGLGTWIEGQTAFFARGISKVAASATWSDPDTLQLTLRFYETPFTQNITCRFSGDTVKVDACMNANMGPKESPTLIGKAA